MTRDKSSVFHVDALDSYHAGLLRGTFGDKPWLFETDEELIAFATEEEACAVQRIYRTQMGFDPITGEKK